MEIESLFAANDQTGSSLNARQLSLSLINQDPRTTCKSTKDK